MGILVQTRLRGLGAGFMLATLLASFAAFSQSIENDQGRAADFDELEPAVNTSAPLATGTEFEPAVNTSESAVTAPENLDPESVDPESVDDKPLEPAVPTAVLAADVSRSQSGGRVMDRMELSRTEITGNQELPKVLYIVPWQKADPGDLMGRPVNTLLDEVLAPIDREEFVRTVDYYGDLYETEQHD